MLGKLIPRGGKRKRGREGEKEGEGKENKRKHILILYYTEIT